MVKQKIRSAVRIGWVPVTLDEYGWTVVVFDPEEPDLAIPIDPSGVNPRAYRTPTDARLAAIAALRDLADRIEKGEP